MNDCTCIIIDDDDDIVTTYADILSYEGVKILGKGHSGKDAVELYKQHVPKFVLLDMNMPDFDGVYAIKHIKEFDPNAKIIIMTAYSELEPDLSDVFAVMEKPGDVTGVLDLLKGIC